VIPTVLLPALIVGLVCKRWQPLALAVVMLAVIWGLLIALDTAEDLADVLGAVTLGGVNAAIGAAVGSVIRLTATGLSRPRPSS
jgi:hypothetical protein